MDFPIAYGRSLIVTGLILLAGSASAHAAETGCDDALCGTSAALLAASKTVYVAPGGDDALDCLSPATACASFDAGYRAAAPGDVVEVAEGSYPPQVFSEDASKTSELDVLVRPAPGAQVVVGCDGPDNCLATEGADHLTVEGVATAYLEPVFVAHLQRSMPRQGGVALDRGSEDVTFRNVDAGHLWFAAGDSAVLGGDYGPTVDEDSKVAGGDGSNQLIDGAVFHDHWDDVLHMQCIWLAGADGVTIRRSRFDTCAVFSIFSTPEVGQTYRDVVIENNFFSNSGNVSMSTHVKVGSHGGECVNFVIRNNTFVDENVISDCGIEQGSATNIRWIGNIFSDWNTGGECALGGHVFDYNVIEDGNACGPHDHVVGPGNAGFVDRAARNFRLRPDSPAIDRASPTEFPALDIDGNPRPRGSAPDAGAHELATGQADDTKPTIDVRTPIADATYARDATVLADYDCADETALASCVGTVADNQAIDTATLGAHDFTVTATDLAANTSTRTVTYTVADRTQPTIDLRTPTADATYARGQTVLADFDCADETGGSGLGACEGTVAAGAAVDTATLGEHRFTITASDRQGNAAVRMATYTVVAAPTDPGGPGTGVNESAPPGAPATLEVRRFGPQRWRRDVGGPTATLTFREPTRAQVLSTGGLAVGVDCRRRCSASVLLRVRGAGATVRVRARQLKLTSRRQTLRLPLTGAQLERLLDAGTLRLRLNAAVTDARGRRATLAVAPLTAAQ